MQGNFYVMNLSTTHSDNCNICGSWIEHLKRLSGKEQHKCLHCGGDMIEGAHVNVYGYQGTYVVPLCKDCMEKSGWFLVNGELTDFVTANPCKN
ncbi:MAG: hypothetical protein ACEPOV_04490 [Hyphomicrobiales bacterium]